MKEQLSKLLALLSPNDKEKILIEIELDEKIKEIFNGEKIIVKTISQLNNLHSVGLLGLIDETESKFWLAHINNSNKVVLKPKEIQDYLNRNEE